MSRENGKCVPNLPWMILDYPVVVSQFLGGICSSTRPFTIIINYKYGILPKHKLYYPIPLQIPSLNWNCDSTLCSLFKQHFPPCKQAWLKIQIYSITGLTERKIWRGEFLVSIQLLPECMALHVPKTRVLHPKSVAGRHFSPKLQCPWRAPSNQWARNRSIPCRILSKDSQLHIKGLTFLP